MKLIIDKVVAASPDPVDPNKVRLPDYIGGDVERATEFTLDSISTLIKDITAIAFDVIIILGVLFIIYSSFLYITSYGDESKSEIAKKTLLWAIIGTVISFLAKTLVNTIDTLLGSNI